MFIAALFIIAKNWKQAKVPHQEMDKLWDIHTRGYYIPIKTKELQMYAIMWVNHRNNFELKKMEINTRCFHVYKMLNI